MPNEESLTLADIERETDRFLMPHREGSRYFEGCR